MAEMVPYFLRVHQIYETLIILAQLRHMPEAKWSKEPAIENHQHIFSVGKI